MSKVTYERIPKLDDLYGGYQYVLTLITSCNSMVHSNVCQSIKSVAELAIYVYIYMLTKIFFSAIRHIITKPSMKKNQNYH